MNLCFANHNGKCVCLTDGVCGRPCRFLKTEEELAAHRKRAVRRLKSLPEDQQLYIRKKYYNGGEFR
jgi:hypothetical protein